jgi:SPX domain protein involved in polyphosphate accumulation
VSFRKEKKFRVTLSDFYKFHDQLHQQGMETLFEPRLITSVYFDTVDLNMFHDSEEGVLPRKKVRIRWYNDVQLFTLENKISSIEGRFKMTSKLENSISENKIFTRNRLDAQYGQIQPTLKVSYKRSYFVFNKMRITFDKDICYQNLKYEDKRKYYDPERVIEIKIPANCPDEFVERLIPFPTARFSKYSRGVLFSLGDLIET